MIKKIFFVLLPFLGISQIQIGQNIYAYPSEGIGNNVAISANGKVVAMDGSNASGACSRVYENISGVWTQIGMDINRSGSIGWHDAGKKVALSADGSIVAIADRHPYVGGLNYYPGTVGVYENISGVWTQIGQDIDYIPGEILANAPNDNVSLSADGSILAIGAPKAKTNDLEPGIVHIYQNVGGTWVQLGQNIEGEADKDSSGWDVSLSADGSIVAIGAPGNDDNGSYSGHVRVYEYASGVWTQIGQDIDGEVAGDMSGRSVSLSANGKIVAIGSPLNKGYSGSFYSGQVRIYEYTGGVWIQVGQDIEGTQYSGQSGCSVSLSADGYTVAIGAFKGGLGHLGHVYVYRYLPVPDIWAQVGQTVSGIGTSHDLGKSVAISSDGTVVAMGAPRAYENGLKTGHVRVYDYSTASSDSFVLENFNIYPNPATDVLNISLDDNLILEKVTIYNSLGQVVKTSKDAVVNVENMVSGVYFVEVITNQGKATKKVIKK